MIRLGLAVSAAAPEPDLRLTKPMLKQLNSNKK
jgi:hypothetical protein